MYCERRAILWIAVNATVHFSASKETHISYQCGVSVVSFRDPPTPAQMRWRDREEKKARRVPSQVP